MLPSGEGSVSAEEFARGVHDTWRIGKHGCDNGFLLVVSRVERTFAISVVSRRHGPVPKASDYRILTSCYNVLATTFHAFPLIRDFTIRTPNLTDTGTSG